MFDDLVFFSDSFLVSLSVSKPIFVKIGSREGL